MTKELIQELGLDPFVAMSPTQPTTPATSTSSTTALPDQLGQTESATKPPSPSSIASSVAKAEKRRGASPEVLARARSIAAANRLRKKQEQANGTTESPVQAPEKKAKTKAKQPVVKGVSKKARGSRKAAEVIDDTPVPDRVIVPGEGWPFPSSSRGYHLDV